MSGASPRAAAAALAGSVFCFGVAISLSCGRLALSPYDQSLVFDGGWRLLCGQVPFRDFLAPLGITPFLIQAGFFALFGVSWFTYALHAAILNGVFGLLVTAFLWQRGARRPLAAFFGLLSTVVFTPPFGLPHSEQHAFVFSIAAFVAAEWAIHHPRSRSSSVAWGALAPLSALALLSKQVPTIPLLAVLALRCAVARPARTRRAIRSVALSAVATLALLVALAVALRIEPERIRLSLLELPYETGSPRLQRLLRDVRALLPGAMFTGVAGPAALAALGSGAATVLRGVSRWCWPYASFLLVPALGAAAVLLAPLRKLRPPPWLAWVSVAAAAGALASPGFLFVAPGSVVALAAGAFTFRLADASRWEWARTARLAIGAATATLSAVALFALWSPLLGLAAETLGLGLLFAAPLLLLSRRPLESLLDAALVSSFLLSATLFVMQVTNQEPENGAALVFLCTGLLAAEMERLVRRTTRGTVSGPALAVLALVLGAGTVDAVRFHRDVNLTRRIFLREGFVPDPEPRPADFPDSMRFAVLQRGGEMRARDLAELFRFFGQHRENFLLLGQSRFLYGITGRPSVDPALWDHAGLAFPRPGTPSFLTYDRDLRAACLRYAVRWVVIERTPEPAARVAALPWLRRIVEAPPGGSLTIGPWRIVDARETLQTTR